MRNAELQMQIKFMTFGFEKIQEIIHHLNQLIANSHEANVELLREMELELKTLEEKLTLFKQQFMAIQ